MEKSKITITVAGQKYTILTDEEPQNVQALAKELDRKLGDYMGNSHLPVVQALILSALDFGSTALIQRKNADETKDKLSHCLADLEISQGERDRLKRENEKLKEKLADKK